MSTRPIPVGSCNFAVNMPKELRAEAGRLAAMEDEPLGAWIREMLREKVAAARKSGRLAQAGQLAMRLGVWAVFLSGSLITMGEALVGEAGERKGVRVKEQVRVVRVIRREGV